MTFLEYKEKFKIALEKNGLSELSDEIIEKFYNSQEYILEKNKSMNLTAICSDEEFIYRHWIDSLKINKYIGENGNVIDIGTGSGIVALSIGIVKKDAKVTALDSTNKKIEFLDELCLKLDINNIIPICSRAEEYVNDKREYFDVCTARAVADLQILNEICIPYVKIGGIFAPMKGKNGTEELERAKNGAVRLGCKLVKDDEYELFESNEASKRHIFVFEKISSTNNIYPRTYSQIMKKPL